MILLGSSGSIGRNAFEIAMQYNIPIEMLVVGENIDILNQQIAKSKPKFVVIKDSNNAKKVQLSPQTRLFCGEDGILEALNLTQSNLVINALVGLSGLKPSLESLRLNKTLALANKETLVVAGEFIDTKRIIPIDSEHFALSELCKNKSNIKKYIITASGGAFRDCNINEIAHKNASEALKHPNWKMGKKITIDSATMMNKLFEILEARWLFDSTNIDALLERNSLIHALIQTNDNALFAHFGIPDMGLPISYALLGEKAQNIDIIKELDLLSYSFRFEAIDTSRYPLWNLKNNLLNNPRLGVILNASNEILVERFLENKIPFGKIAQGVLKAIECFSSMLRNINSIDDIIQIDREVRRFSRQI